MDLENFKPFHNWNWFIDSYPWLQIGILSKTGLVWRSVSALLVLENVHVFRLSPNNMNLFVKGEPRPSLNFMVYTASKNQLK